MTIKNTKILDFTLSFCTLIFQFYIRFALLRFPYKIKSNPGYLLDNSLKLLTVIPSCHDAKKIRRLGIVNNPAIMNLCARCAPVFYCRVFSKFMSNLDRRINADNDPILKFDFA